MRGISILIFLLILQVSMLAVSCSQAVLKQNRSGDTETPIDKPTEMAVPSHAPQNDMVNPSKLQTITPTLKNNSSIDGSSLKYKIAYRLYKPAEARMVQTNEIWVVEYIDLIPRKIFSYRQSSDFFAEPSWSNAGNRIAIDQSSEGFYFITIIDLDTNGTNTYKIDSVNFTGLTSNNTLITPLRWSSNDQWIAFTIIDVENFEHFQTVLLDLNSGRNWLLSNGIEFVSWLQKTEDRFIYLQHTISASSGAGDSFSDGVDSPTLNLGQIGVEMPLKTISGLGKAAPLGWGGVFPNPNDRFILTISRETDPPTLVKSDLESEAWEVLPYHPSSGTWLGNWSPDGNWLLVYDRGKAYFWNFTKSDLPDPRIIPLEDYLLYPVWSRDSKYLIYQDSLKILKVQPTNPEYAISIIDLSFLKNPQDSFQSISFYMWLP